MLELEDGRWSSDDFRRMLFMSGQSWWRRLVIQLSVRSAAMSLNTTIRVQSMEFGIRDHMSESIDERR
jgi:hypothetical protein